jgi:esterase/lipase
MTSSEKNYLPIAQKLAEKGIVGLTLSIRGHGDSDGNFDNLTILDAIQDGFNAYDFLTSYDFIDNNRIGVCGASLGAAIALAVAQKHQVKSLVLRVPALYTPEMIDMTYKKIMSDEENIFAKISDFSEIPAIKSMEYYKGNLLIVTSENDSVIPPQIPKALLENAISTKSKKLVEIKDATHALLNDKWREQFVRNTVQWFSKTL